MQLNIFALGTEQLEEAVHQLVLADTLALGMHVCGGEGVTTTVVFPCMIMIFIS